MVATGSEKGINKKKKVTSLIFVSPELGILSIDKQLCPTQAARWALFQTSAAMASGSSYRGMPELQQTLSFFLLRRRQILLHQHQLCLLQLHVWVRMLEIELCSIMSPSNLRFRWGQQREGGEMNLYMLNDDAWKTYFRSVILHC